MKIADTVLNWYIKNAFIPQIEIFDKPGFILEKIPGNKANRQIFLPESFFIDIEKQFNEIPKGVNLLYQVGKTFGYQYSSNFLPDKNDPTYLSVLDFFVKYIGTTYASNIDYKFDKEKDLLDITVSDFIICHESGIGLLIGAGGIAGIWSYVLQNQDIEGVMSQCQGRGDKFCKIYSAPVEVLKELGLDPIIFKEVPKDKIPDQNDTFNACLPTKWSKHSLRNLIDSKIFSYDSGRLNLGENRFFEFDLSLPYILEDNISKFESKTDTSPTDMLWNISVKAGKKIVPENSSIGFVTDLYSAIGFGDILITKNQSKYSVIIDHFPWHPLAKNINFIIFRGLLSGALSKIEKTEINLANLKISEAAGHLSCVFSE